MEVFFENFFQSLGSFAAFFENFHQKKNLDANLGGLKNWYRSSLSNQPFLGGPALRRSDSVWNQQAPKIISKIFRCRCSNTFLGGWLRIHQEGRLLTTLPSPQWHSNGRDVVRYDPTRLLAVAQFHWRVGVVFGRRDFPRKTERLAPAKCKGKIKRWRVLENSNHERCKSDWKK